MTEECARGTLVGARFECVDLTGSSFHLVDPAGARFVGADLSGVVMRAVDVDGVQIDAPWPPNGESPIGQAVPGAEKDGCLAGP